MRRHKKSIREARGGTSARWSTHSLHSRVSTLYCICAPAGRAIRCRGNSSVHLACSPGGPPSIIDAFSHPRGPDLHRIQLPHLSYLPVDTDPPARSAFEAIVVALSNRLAVWKKKTPCTEHADLILGPDVYRTNYRVVLTNERWMKKYSCR